MQLFCKMKKAFSMVELIFVIVVLGIVASIGSAVIAQIYQNTVIQKAMALASLKSEIAAEQIANRLSYAIPWSVVAKVDTDTLPVALPAYVAGGPQNTLEWIGVDGDSFEATNRPGWSGYCDVQDNGSWTSNRCSTPGSNLVSAGTIIQSLGGAGIGDAVAIFKTDQCNTAGVMYGFNTMGMDSANFNTTCAFSLVNNGGGATLNMANNPVRITADMYALGWSAYALVPTAWRDINGDGANDVFDLTLRYNYQPWLGESFPSAASQVVATNVSVFRFAQSENTIRFKICIKQPVGSAAGDFVSMCKERTVIR